MSWGVTHSASDLPLTYRESRRLETMPSKPTPPVLGHVTGARFNATCDALQLTGG
jgi:hypothetical protein